MLHTEADGERQSYHDGLLRIEAGPREGLDPLDEEHPNRDQQEPSEDWTGNGE